MINDEKYDTGKIFLFSLLSQAIISSVDISKTVAEFITRYRNLDFGEVDEKARQLNLINTINKNISIGVYPLGEDFVVIFTIRQNEEKITSCMFIQEFLASKNTHE